MKRFPILNKILVYILLTSMLLGFLSDGSASRINGAEGLSQADTIPKGGYPQWDNDGDGGTIQWNSGTWKRIKFENEDDEFSFSYIDFTVSWAPSRTY